MHKKKHSRNSPTSTSSISGIRNIWTMMAEVVPKIKEKGFNKIRFNVTIHTYDEPSKIQNYKISLFEKEQNAYQSIYWVQTATHNQMLVQWRQKITSKYMVEWPNHIAGKLGKHTWNLKTKSCHWFSVMYSCVLLIPIQHGITIVCSDYCINANVIRCLPFTIIQGKSISMQTFS